MKRSCHNDFDKMIAEARVHGLKMDAIDRKAGFATPGDGGSAVIVATAMSAIECAIRTNDWAAAADAWVLLEPLDTRKAKA